ncbi:MAG: protein kinase family protein [Proteobacteria bacterium]|nr:protein kinase family protein [Pseudomonadota bacterium]
MTTQLSPDSIIPFLRRKDYVFVRSLGKGACGETVLLHDDLIDGFFVCKKYSPFAESLRQALFKSFLREIKLLHEVHHQNVVRVFNYYVYPDKLTGYILMEYVRGLDIEEHLRAQPETVNELFVQAIDGFSYLESVQVLHRDIRPQNLLVRDDGVLKIIDLGFGKQIKETRDFDKSITLNWWCEPPAEFSIGTYNHSTEVYFVAKLFQKIIAELGIKQFKHAVLLDRMCRRDPADRVPTFLDAKNELSIRRSEDIEFESEERDIYRRFAVEFSGHFTKIAEGAKYVTDLDRIRPQLEAIYRNCMLEDELPDCASLLRIFVNGQYYYRKANFKTSVLREFIHFLRSASLEKQRIALANLHTRLDAIKRYVESELDDDIPF